MRFPLIVFDWDGTLIDSASAIVECIQEASRELGLEIPDHERASHVIGLGLHDSLRIAVPELPEERYLEFSAVYRRHFLAREDSMELFPGIRELLGELCDRGHRLAVATGKSRKGLERSLHASGLRHCFAATRCGDETHPKPHPAMLLEIIQVLGANAEGSLMIGDTSHDLQMARNAQVDAVGVSYGAHRSEMLIACGPRGCFDTVEALRRWLVEHA